jgi:hypothetical protein
MDKCAREELGMDIDSFAVAGFPVLLRSLGIRVSSKSESESDSLESELESLPLSLELSDNTPTADATYTKHLGHWMNIIQYIIITFYRFNLLVSRHIF